ncbi:hypothetical protein ACFWVP_23350 [Streptomyces sp. NPDC058637]|uniref:hypothetical protein n=1 Tax=Streptomyces sp. NPDC058637 TaxID=3346569 RepID=UPI00364AEFB7
MNLSGCPVIPATARELSENDPGFNATGAAPVAATPVVLAAGFALGVMVSQAIGDSKPIDE